MYLIFAFATRIQKPAPNSFVAENKRNAHKSTKERKKRKTGRRNRTDAVGVCVHINFKLSTSIFHVHANTHTHVHLYIDKTDEYPNKCADKTKV